MKKWTWRVSEGQAGIRLLAFLRQECKEAPSVKALKRAVDSKCCLVNGTIETFSSCTLHAGDLVSLELVEEKEEKPLQILYEDDTLYAVNKPVGLVVTTAAFKGSFLVHRLDKETSGVLLIAKNSSMKAALEALFKEHKINKLYLAIVDGKVTKDKGIIDRPIGKKGAYAGQTVYGVMQKGEGVRAITHYQVLCRAKSASVIACEPKTGRTHQLRVHLSFIGHPILGDRQYAKAFGCSYAPKRNLLHAYQLEFEHPLTKKPLKLIAPIPLDFKEAMDTLDLKLPV